MFGPYLPAQQEAVEIARAAFERAQRAHRQAETLSNNAILPEVRARVPHPEWRGWDTPRRAALAYRLEQKKERAANALRDALFPGDVVPVVHEWCDGVTTVTLWIPGHWRTPLFMSRTDYAAWCAHRDARRAWEKRFMDMENGVTE